MAVDRLEKNASREAQDYNMTIEVEMLEWFKASGGSIHYGRPLVLVDFALNISCLTDPIK